MLASAWSVVACMSARKSISVVRMRLVARLCSSWKSTILLMVNGLNSDAGTYLEGVYSWWEMHADMICVTDTKRVERCPAAVKRRDSDLRCS